MAISRRYNRRIKQIEREGQKTREMPIEKKSFVNYTLDEDKADPKGAGKILTMRLNPKEYKQLREDMKLLNISRESTAYKFMHDTGRNVLHNTFGRANLRRIFDPRRVKEEIEDTK